MIITVTLNPAIDISYRVNNFNINKGHRVENGLKTAGGKGLNVSRVLKQLGEQSLCLGFLGGQNGKWIKKRLEMDGMEQSFTTITEETRTCLAIIDEDHSTQTELLEKGPNVSEEEKERFLETFNQQLKKAKLIIASGSLPLGLEPSFYKEICKLVKEENIPFFLDTSGESLKLGIEGSPFLIKPNQEELSQFAGKELMKIEEMVEVAVKICNQGVQNVLLSLGENGAMLVRKDTILKADIPTIPVVNPVGSGDSMIAGMAYSINNGFDLKESLRMACACGMANAMEAKTGFVQPEIIKQLLSEINITTL
ncbi:1-phosphofructokinase [Bacillus sp. FJAT-49732]|uniref:Tagatose-6-phosphate kinase n=1 Tax=Lederbergia citrisecunda TaxID=2833583 RepID=A0A942YLB8_9BACI|nr:1-phosphofructokinase [Lederbergia citrisecunda]MBS4198201.1 1-phosphofructokinase [Lederbergia citrisecunda]